MTCDGLASRPGEVEILLAASCYKNREKLRQLWASLGSKASLHFLLSHTVWVVYPALLYLALLSIADIVLAPSSALQKLDLHWGKCLHFLCAFLPGFHGQLISVTYSRRTAQGRLFALTRWPENEELEKELDRESLMTIVLLETHPAMKSKSCLGPISRKPRKLFGPVKPFLVHLYLQTERCIRLKLLVWREPLFILRNRKHVQCFYRTNDWMQENHTTSNKTTWPLCCRISCRNSRTRRHLKCKQNKFDSKAGTTARAIETLIHPVEKPERPISYKEVKR